MFPLGAFIRIVCTLSSVMDCNCCDVSVPYVRHLQHIASQQYTSDLTAGLPRWRSRAGRLFAACRPWLRRCYQHCLKTRRRVSYPPRLYVASAFAAVCMTVKPASPAVTPVYCLRTAASVSCCYVSCSVVWTGVVLTEWSVCSISTATSRTHTTFLLLAEMFDITGRT